MVGHRQPCSEATYNLKIQSVYQAHRRGDSAVRPSVEVSWWDEDVMCVSSGPVADLAYGGVKPAFLSL